MHPHVCVMMILLRLDPFPENLHNILIQFWKYEYLYWIKQSWIAWITAKKYLPINKLSTVHTPERPLTNKMIHTEAASSNLKISYRIWLHISRRYHSLLNNRGVNWELIVIKWFMTINRWGFEIHWGRSVKLLQVKYGRSLHRCNFCIMT